LKDAVIAQRFGGLDPTQAKNERIKQRLQRFADAVTVVPLRESDALKERTLQLDARHASKLGETQSVGGDPKNSWSPGITSKPRF